MTEPLLSLPQAAELTGYCSATIRRWVASGHLPAYRVGPRGIRVKRSDLDALAVQIPAASAR
ncbi:MAG: helix-turn-helix transcriptional regulator [Mycobacteriales bacterium]